MYEPDLKILDIGRALGDSTRFAIYSHIASSPKPTTVKELVDTFGLHHSAIRIHLHKLQESGLVTCRKLSRGGMVGRPQLAFVTGSRPLSITLPPRNYQFLAQLVLDLAMADGVTSEALDSFGFAWGRRYMRERVHGDGALDPTKALDIVCKEINDDLGGSLQHESLNGDGYALVETNCLFSDVATAHDPSVCLLHQAAIRGMLSELSGKEFVFDHSASLAKGSDHCYTQVVPREN
jgi:predicted ArsR family transcriptional regulator